MYRETGNVQCVTVCTVHVSETVQYVQCVRVYSTYCGVTGGPKDRTEDDTTLLAGQLAATSETSSATSQQ